MTLYVVDTHALNWYLTGDRQLSRKVKAILDNLDAGDDYIYVPTLVLAEMMTLE